MVRNYEEASATRRARLPVEARSDGAVFGPVSYTHLDVYKRQHIGRVGPCTSRGLRTAKVDRDRAGRVSGGCGGRGGGRTLPAWLDVCQFAAPSTFVRTLRE